MFNETRDARIDELESEVTVLQSESAERKADFERLNNNYNDLSLRLDAIEHPNPYSCCDRVVYNDDVCTIVGSEQVPFTGGTHMGMFTNLKEVIGIIT